MGGTTSCLNVLESKGLPATASLNLEDAVEKLFQKYEKYRLDNWKVPGYDWIQP